MSQGTRMGRLLTGRYVSLLQRLRSKQALLDWERSQAQVTTRAELETLEARVLLSVTPVIDYSFDTQGFFSLGLPDGQLRRDVLEAAASDLFNNLGDTLDAVTPGTIYNQGQPSQFQDQLRFTHPGTGSVVSSTTVVAQDTILIYAGGRNLGGSLGVGGPGGSSGISSFVQGSSSRGEAGALLAQPTDFGPWGGSIAFNTSSTWHFGLTTTGLGAGENDFYSVALHELTHMLGFGTAGSWTTARSGSTFIGAAAQAEYDLGGSVPLAPDNAHWANGTTDGGVETAMDPSLIVGTRKNLTALDLAALDDIGWEILAEQSFSVVIGNTSIQSTGNVVSGFVDIRFDVPAGLLEELAGYFFVVDVTPGSSGLSLTGASSPAGSIFAGQTPSIGSTGNRLEVSDNLDGPFDSETIVDDGILFRLHFDVAPGTSGVFTLDDFEFQFIDALGNELTNLTVVGGSVTVTTSQSPADLVALSFDADLDHVVGGTTTVTFEIANTGSTAVGAFSVNIVLSNNSIFGDADDTLVQTVNYPGLAGSTSFIDSILLALPRNVLNNRAQVDDPLGQALPYVSTNIDFLGLVLDPNNAVPESNESNNLNQGQGIDRDDVTYFPWDTNRNGLVTQSDVIFIINRLGENIPPGDPRADPNGSTLVTQTDAIVAINRLGYERNSSVIEVPPGLLAAFQQSEVLPVEADNLLPDSTEPVSVSDVPEAGDRMQVTLQLIDLDGTPGIQIGEQFDVAFHFTEINTPNGARAVFSGYADVNFNAAMLQAIGSLSYGPSYTFQKTGTINNSTGLIDEAGATSESFSSPPASDVIYTVRFTATQAGQTLITTDPGEGGLAENVIYGGESDVRLNTFYGELAIDVLPPPTPAVSIDDVSVVEGNSGTQVMTFTVTLSSPATGPISMLASTANGSAIAGGVAAFGENDYVTRTNIPINFSAGQTSQTFTVTINGDTIKEPDETFFVNLSDLTGNAIFADAQGVGTITNGGDTVPAVFITDIVVLEGNTGSEQAVLTIELTAPNTGAAVSGTFNTSSGSADSGIDFVGHTGTAWSIPQGQFSTTISIDVLGDFLVEGDETFTVSLFNLNGATAGDTTATVTIQENDNRVITISDAEIVEGNTGSTNMVFTIFMNDVRFDGPVTGTFSTSSGTASSGSDFTGQTGVAWSIAAGEQSTTISVPILGDTLGEEDETFTVTLLNVVGADTRTQVGSDTTATGTITNDDVAVPVVSIADAQVTEIDAAGLSMTFTISLNAAHATSVVSGTFNTIGGTAGGGDFTNQSGTPWSIPQGQTSTTISVPITGDFSIESTETFTVQLFNLLNATAGDVTATGTILDNDTRFVTIADPVAVTEGDTGTTNLIFTISVNQARPDGAVTGTFNTNGVTANPGSDFTGQSGIPWTIAQGATTTTISVPIVGDFIIESTETFNVLLFNVVGADAFNASSDTTATGTILDNDTRFVTIADPAAITEGDTGTTNLLFTISVNQARPDGAVTGTFNTNGVTANAGTDFTGQSGIPWTIAQGATTTTISVPIVGDFSIESTETFTVTLFNVVGADAINASADTTATGTILDNDTRVVTIADPAAIVEGDTGTTNLIFTISVNQARPDGPVTGTFNTSNGTASAGTDFTGQSGVVWSIPQGQTSTTISVPIVGDTTIESTETFTVTLFNVVGADSVNASADITATGTILDDDTITLQVADAQLAEGNSGTASMQFTITLNKARLTGAVTGTFNTTNGTATAGSDFTAQTGVAWSIAAGQTSTTISVPIVGDINVEPNENFTVTLFNIVNADGANAASRTTATGTIINDDSVTLSINDVTATEGNASTKAFDFTVTLNQASASTVTVNFATNGGSATSGVDFVANNNTLTFTPGQTTKTITVLVNGDTTFEADETFTVVLSSPTNAAILDGTGLGTITNDDAIPTVSVDSVVRNEGLFGSTLYDFVLRLSAASAQTVSVTVNTSDGSATVLDGDYTAISGLVVQFAPGQTQQTVTVNVTGDNFVELNENFIVTLSNPVNATVQVTATAVGSSFTVGGGTGIGIAVDPVTGNVFVRPAGSILEFTPAGTEVLPAIDSPGVDSTSFDLDFLTEAAVINGVNVPAGSLLAINGNETPNKIFAINKDTGVVLATLNIAASNTVGGAYHNGRDTFFVLNFGTDAISEINPATGAILNTFSISPPGSGSFDVNFGDVAIDQATGNLLIVGSSQNSIREMSPTGVFLRNISVTGISGLSGIAVNDATREVWLTNTSGLTQRFTLPISSAVGAIVNDDTAVFSIAPGTVSQAEGNVGTTAFNYTVSVSNPIKTPVTVTVNTVNGTATVADNDFVPISGQILTFPAGGSQSQNLIVNVVGDTKVEANESFTIQLSSPTGPSSLGVSSATATITNDDLPSLSISNVQLTEGDSSTKIFAFTVTLSNASASDVTVQFDTLNESATAGTDYVAHSELLTFTPGQLTKTVNVTVNGDTTVEPDERFLARLSNPSNAQISAAPSSLGSITPNLTGTELGIGFDPVSGNLFINTSDGLIHEIRPNGLEVLPTIIAPGIPTSDARDIDFLPEAVNIGGTLVPAGTMLAIDGREGVNKLYAINKDTGAVIAQVNTTAGSSIGIAYHADRNTVFVLNFSTQVITEINPQTGATINSFTVAPAGTPAFSVSFGDLEIHPVTGNILVVGSSQSAIRELTSTGAFVRDLAIPGIGSISGIAIDDTNLEAWVVNTLGTVFRLNLMGDTGIGRIINDDAAVVSITPPTITQNEGNSSTTAYNFTLTLSNPSQSPVSVTVNTTNGTATAGSDFTAITDQVFTWNPGDPLTKTVTVLVTGDLVDEFQENFTVNLSNVTGIGASIGTASATGVIDNDDAPRITINDVTQVETNSATTNFVFTVSLSNATNEDITVRVDTANGTATAGSDYTAINNQVLTFLAGGSLTQTVTVSVNGDTAIEPTETFFVDLSNATGNAVILDSRGVGTITNDDASEISITGPASVTEGNVNSNAVYTVSLSNPSDSQITVLVSTTSGTATSGSDFTGITSQLVTFAAGETSKQVNVQILGDTLDENDETFTISLSTPSGATISGANGSVTTTILDDDAPPALSINDVTATEGNASTKAFDFTVTLSAPSAKTVTVNFATLGGSATSGVDFVANNNTLTFNPGETSKTITVLVNGDTTVEGNETFTVNLSGASNATIADGTGLGTITNDDAAVISIAGPATIAEGNSSSSPANYTVSLSNPSDSVITVVVNTSNGTATAGQDYTAITSQTITFNPGETSKPIAVQITGDLVDENDETYTIALSNPAGATISGAAGSVTTTIVDDDGTPALTINDVTLAEGNASTTQFVFTVTLSNASASVVSASFTTNGITATDGIDFQGNSGTVTFNPGDPLTKTITILVNGDNRFEADETFNVVLSNASNASIADGTGLGTISNDDLRPTITITSASASEGDALTFNLTLSNPSDEVVTVLATVNDGTATTVDNDYTDINGQLITFAAGVTSQTFVVQTIEDTKFEADQTIAVALSGAVNAGGVAGSPATGTILNDDVRPTITIVSATAAEGDVLSFLVSLSNASDEVVSVTANVNDGTATVADGDYTDRNGVTITFAAGVTSQNFLVQTIEDAKFETDETISVVLSGAVNAAGITGSPATGTILNDDVLPVLNLTLSGGTIIEGNPGEDRKAVFTVTLSAAINEAVTFRATTTGGTATSDVDFTAINDVLITIPAGQTTATIEVSLIEDFIFEGDETFTLTIASPSANATIGAASAQVTITDDDAQPKISITGQTSVVEGDGGSTQANYTVTLSNPSAQTITVLVNTADGTAQAGSDYTGINGQLITFNPGETSKPVTVQITGDTDVEPNETYTVALGSPSNATLSLNASVTTTIINDDQVTNLPPTAVAGGPYLVQEGDSVQLDGSGSTDPDQDPSTLTYEWDLDNDGQFDDATGITPTFDASLIDGDAAGTVLTIGLRVTDAGGLSDISTTTVIVTNFAPIADAGGPYVVSEGGSVQLAGSAEDPSPTDQANLTFAWDLDNDGQFDDATGATPTFDASLIDGIAGGTVQTIRLRATDPDGESTISESTVTINNLAPTLTNVTVTPVINENASVTLTGNINDASPLDAFTLTIDWGNGVEIINLPAGTTSFNQQRQYLDDNPTGTPGDIVNISVTVADDDGGTSAPANTSTTVNNVAPVATPIAGPGSGTIGQQMSFSSSFTDVGTLDTHTTAWEVRDAANAIVATGSGLSFNFTPAGVGAFTVSFTVTDDDTGSDTESLAINVAAQPVPTVTLSRVGPAAVSEGNASFFDVFFDVTLDFINSDPVQVQVLATDLSATLADGDYAFLGPASLTFTPGNPLTQQVAIRVFGDNKFEADESLRVELGTVTGANKGASQADLTITNDDLRPTANIGNASVTEGNLGSVAALFTITLSNPSSEQVTVNVTTQDGSATATDGDYQSLVSQPVVFAPGQTSAQVTVNVNGDTKFEADQSFLATIASVINGTAGTNGTGTILNDDARPTISISGGTSITEGNGGQQLVNLTVQLSHASDEVISVDVISQDGTATDADSDYEPVNLTLTFNPNGLLSQNVAVAINGDVTFESDEAFTVGLVNASNASIAASGAGQASITILNDDNQVEPVLVTGNTINNGDPQRSNIDELTVAFNVDVNIAALITSGQITSAVRLMNTTTNTQVVLDVSRYQYDSASHTLRINLTAGGFGGGDSATILPDGRFQLQLDTNVVASAALAGNKLVDDDGVADGLYRINFHRLLGDYDGDAVIGNNDQTLLGKFNRAVIGDGRYNAIYDLNGDGVINAVDILIARRRLGQSI